MITIRVNGTPVAQGNHARGRYGGVYETSKGHKNWREAIRSETQRVLEASWSRYNGGQPVAVEVTFFMPRPAYHYGTGKNAGKVKASAAWAPTGKKNDIDKLARAVLDGITEGGAVADDGQVTYLKLVKNYASNDDPAGALIVIKADSP